MRHLTVDFTADPPTYTYIVDGVTSTTPARSVFSAVHVAGIVKCRGVSVVTIGQKQALRKLKKKGKPTMALSKSQQKEVIARRLDVLAKLIRGERYDGRAGRTIGKLVDEGFARWDRGLLLITDAGRAYYEQHRDADSAVIDAVAPAEQPAIEQASPLADLPTVEQTAQAVHDVMKAFPSADVVIGEPVRVVPDGLNDMIQNAAYLVQKLETLIERIPDFQVFNADAFTTRDGLLSTIDELADDAIITRLIHTIRVLNDVIDSE